MQKYIWPRIYPLLVLLFSIYPIFLNILMLLNITIKDEPYNKLKKYLQNKNATKFTVWQAWGSLSIIIPAIIICMLEANLGLLTYYFAQSNFTEDVYVSEAKCISVHGKYSHHRFELTIINDNHQTRTIYFPYAMCRNKPEIQNLSGCHIQLYGRFWQLGKVFDGFKYPINLNCTEKNQIENLIAASFKSDMINKSLLTQHCFPHPWKQCV